MHLLEVETFESTFGPKSTRKRAKLSGADYESLVKAAEQKANSAQSLISLTQESDKV